LPGGGRLIEECVEPFAEGDPVAESGERIVESALRELMLEEPLLGDISERYHNSADGRIRTKVTAHDFGQYRCRGAGPQGPVGVAGGLDARGTGSLGVE